MSMFDEPIRADALSKVQVATPLLPGSARRQLDVSVVIVLLTLVMAIVASMTQIVSQGPSTAGGYGIDEIPSLTSTASSSLRG